MHNKKAASVYETENGGRAALLETRKLSSFASAKSSTKVVIVCSEIVILFATPEEIKTYRERLTLVNPAYMTAVRLDLYRRNIPETICLCRSNGDTVILPRGLEEEFTGFEDKRILPPAEFLRFNAILRGYQQTAVDRLMRYANGLLVAACGTGKTVMAIYILSRINSPALIIVHTQDLLRQWQRQVKDLLGIEAAAITAGGCEVGRVTVSTMQTLVGQPDSILNHFGLIIIDECHHVPCNTLSQILNKSKAKYRYGLTATPQRSDGLTKVIQWLVGPVRVRVSAAEVSKDRIKPTVEIQPSNGNAETTLAEDHNELQSSVETDTRRNFTIVQAIKSAIATGRKPLILGKRVSHLKGLSALVEGSIAVSAATKPEAREEALAGLEAGSVAAVFATSNLAAEGLDRPAIDCLILAAPISHEATITQAIGRICRPATGKTSAVVIDFEDSGQGMAGGMFRKRLRIYDSLGLTTSKREGQA